MTETRNFQIGGLNHLGLVVEDIHVARHFFENILGLKVLGDRGELLFFGAGRDVLAVKTPKMAVNKPEHGGEPKDFSQRGGWQSLDHYGFFARTREEVDAFAAHLTRHHIEILKGPYDRSDGRSVYFRDPCGNVGEFFYYEAK